MRVYVESNFVLELALLQAQEPACRGLLELAENRQIELVIPSFSLTEPFETLKRRHTERRRLRVTLEREIRQLVRSATYEKYRESSDEVSALLIDSEQEEGLRLSRTLLDLLDNARTIPFDGSAIRSALGTDSSELSPQDALVLGSVREDLKQRPVREAVFVSRDKDFDVIDVVDELEGLGCKLLTDFRDGLRYVSNATSTPTP